MSTSGARDGLAAEVLARTEQLAAVPAPTGEEAARAEIVRAWWMKDGWDDVHVDAAGNVWARVFGGGGPAVLLVGHLDTVFGAETPHGARREGDRLLGPSVADDSVAVAALSAAGSLVRDAGPRDADLRDAGGPVWLLATVGEEGLGRVSTVGVGSIRQRVQVAGPGGHAWEASDAPSAVHAAARIVAALGVLGIPGARTSVNIGRIGGGEAVNARARGAWFDLEMRAEDPAALAALAQAADDAITQHGGDLELRTEELGRRPAGRVADDHPLVRAAAEALIEAGITPSFPPTSTDANAAHEAGIPAVAVGVTTGGGEHTPDEWIDITPIAGGLGILAATVTNYQEAGR